MAEHHFHTPEPVELELKVPAGDITIETVDGEDSTIVVEGSEKLVEQTFVELHGNRLLVEFRGPKALGITIEIGGWRIGSERLNIRARVPHGSRPVINAVSADCKTSGHVATFEARTMSGDLAVFADVERDATVKTVSGDVRFQSPIGGDLQAQTVSGDLYAVRVGGSLTTKTVSGDVRVDCVRAGKATLQSVSGDITVGIESGTNVDVDANSVSGELDSEVPLGSDSGGLGDGPTVVVRGKTVSGDFRLVRAS